jgi:alkanesulfonate monooxygenase SsuD/methylene tetrahydromethanopterin reductase-like flavin-dependent oxidoreductase (luciferase family)
MIAFGLTDHLEGPRLQPSREIYDSTIRQVQLADRLGFEYAWFSEHHDHAHYGHLPAPLLLALHLAASTQRIRLGTAIICLNLHHPLDVAEQVAIADILSGRRMAVGFGSGSTPREFELFGLRETDEEERHARFAEALRLIRSAWRGRVDEKDLRFISVPAHDPLPQAAGDLLSRSWVAANSLGAARIAGALGFNMLFSHLRTAEQYRAYRAAYREAGGAGLVAANRPVYVGRDDATAYAEAEPALRTLWRRFRDEGKISAATPEPSDVRALCAHPINFIVGGPATVAGMLKDLHDQAHYDVANLEPNWAGLAAHLIDACLHRLAEDVKPMLHSAKSVRS